MATQTKQAAALAQAQNMAALAQQFNTIYAACKSASKSASNSALITTLSNMPTAAQNSDGSISSTTDGTPNTNNPIVVGGFYRSSNAVNNGLAMINAFINFMEGSAVTTLNYSSSADALVN